MAEWSAGQVIAGVAGVLGLGAFVAAYSRGLLDALLPSPARLAGLIRRRDLPLPAGERFVVLIADLQGDDATHSHTRHVAAALEPYRGLEVVRIGPGPEWGVGSRDAFEAEARTLLAARRGDVLVAGDVATAGKGLRLRILPSGHAVAAQANAAEGRRAGEYVLTETGLPLDFDRDFNAILLAVVAASVAPATERQGHYLVDLLEPVAGCLRRLCADLPSGLDEDQRGSAWHALGLANYVLGEQKGESDWLEQAVQAYRAALEIFSRERVPLKWAATQTYLGAALSQLGDRKAGTEQLEQAVRAFRAALEVRTRQDAPIQWATVQNNLGLALSRIGARNRDGERLEEAVAVFRSSLEVRTRERFPTGWALTQSNLGLALLWLGEQESGTERLAQAVAAFRAALSGWAREIVPLYWAGAQSNLGYALRALGERQSDAPAKEFLNQAVAACRAALEEWTRERVPYQWAMAQNNLATALAALGEREERTVHLDEALRAFRAALGTFRATGATHHATGTEANIARAEALLAERRGDSAAE